MSHPPRVRKLLPLAIGASLAFLLTAAPASLAEFEDAVAAAEAGEFALAEAEFTRLAELGDPRGQNGLGVLYMRGHGVELDFVRASVLFREAAALGNRAAQSNLGQLLENGWGVARDDAAAFSWYHRAALQGDAQAQTRLGVMCVEGRGTARDFERARAWFERAAHTGDAEAQAYLGHLYRAGDGVRRDYVKAYAWYGIAAAGGYPSGPELRDTVARLLSRDQLDEARHLARKLYGLYGSSGGDAAERS